MQICMYDSKLFQNIYEILSLRSIYLCRPVIIRTAKKSCLSDIVYVKSFLFVYLNVLYVRFSFSAFYVLSQYFLCWKIQLNACFNFILILLLCYSVKIPNSKYQHTRWMKLMFALLLLCVRTVVPMYIAPVQSSAS